MVSVIFSIVEPSKMHKVNEAKAFQRLCGSWQIARYMNFECCKCTLYTDRASLQWYKCRSGWVLRKLSTCRTVVGSGS